jgi:diaminopimelate decarboxylase
MRTPFYFYDLELLSATIAELLFHAGSIKVHYALKANSNSRILKIISQAGLGADCVSGNEIRKALDCDFKADKIVFAGVGKTDEELEYAIESKLGCIHCESLEELSVINEIAGAKGMQANVAFRLNPDVNANTHRLISTGLSENKFGIPSSDFPNMFQQLDVSEHVIFKGLHFHIGSQITDMNVFKDLVHVANDYVDLFESLGYPMQYLNLGGGLGIDYKHPIANSIPDFNAYFQTINTHLNFREGMKIHVEPGRSIVGQCGTLVSKVLYTKTNGFRNFVVIDAGMTELIRPALYDARHYITGNQTGANLLYDVVGPICESSDTFGKEVNLSKVSRGDMIFIHSAGAYGQVMTSRYNLRQQSDPVYSDTFCLDTLKHPARV